MSGVDAAGAGRCWATTGVRIATTATHAMRAQLKTTRPIARELDCVTETSCHAMMNRSPTASNTFAATGIVARSQLSAHRSP
jgi:hypothetical protein